MKAIIDKFTIFLLLLMFSINASAQVQLGGNPEGLNLFALSPDGETLIGANFPGTIHLWDTTTGAEKDVFISEFTIGAGGESRGDVDGLYLWDIFNENRKIISEPRKFAGVSPDGTFYAVEVQKEVIEGNNTNTYLLWTISPEEAFMDVAAHGKLATRWADLK